MGVQLHNLTPLIASRGLRPVWSHYPDTHTRTHCAQLVHLNPPVIYTQNCPAAPLRRSEPVPQHQLQAISRFCARL